MSPTFKSIIHPTDFSEASRSAFAHGLKLAVASKGRFAVVHSTDDTGESEALAEGFPGVRDTLAGWGLLDLKAPAESVEEALGMRVSKVDLGGGDTVETLVSYIARHEGDLLVLATHARDGLPRWLKGSIAEAIARESTVPTLFLPHGARGFVEPLSGAARLANILVPVDHAPSSKTALVTTARLVELLGADAAKVHALHIGDTAAPRLALPASIAARTERLDLDGPVIDTIVGSAEELDADLIVMATAGRHGFLDALRGSTTEAVLRRANRPLLAVPA